MAVGYIEKFKKMEKSRKDGNGRAGKIDISEVVEKVEYKNSIMNYLFKGKVTYNYNKTN